MASIPAARAVYVICAPDENLKWRGEWGRALRAPPAVEATYFCICTAGLRKRGGCGVVGTTEIMHGGGGLQRRFR